MSILFGSLSDYASRKAYERRERLGIPHDVEERKAEHRRQYGDNKIKSIDIQATFDQLSAHHFDNFDRGAKFPPQYQHVLRAHERQGYEIARYGSILECRRMFIEEHLKLTNNHYKTETTRDGIVEPGREISAEGLNLLAMCSAYDEYVERVKRAENHAVVEHRKRYAKDRLKNMQKEAIEINGGMAGEKRAIKQIAVAEFEGKSFESSDRDVLDDLGDGIKRFFKLW